MFLNNYRERKRNFKHNENTDIKLIRTYYERLGIKEIEVNSIIQGN